MLMSSNLHGMLSAFYYCYYFFLSPPSFYLISPFCPFFCITFYLLPTSLPSIFKLRITCWTFSLSFFDSRVRDAPGGHSSLSNFWGTEGDDEQQQFKPTRRVREGPGGKDSISEVSFGFFLDRCFWLFLWSRSMLPACLALAMMDGSLLLHILYFLHLHDRPLWLWLSILTSISAFQLF